MNLFNDVKQIIIAALHAIAARGELPAGLDFSNITIEPPRDPSHGDMATNAALVLAKQAGKKPQDLAALLIAELKDKPLITSAELAGPGFINLRIADASWRGIIPTIFQEKERFGQSDIGQHKKINLEYVSANPTGPLHIGHARGAIYGDALAELLLFTGHEVVKEYYINDAGAQIDTLARSAFHRYAEALGESVGAIPTGLYPGDYVIPIGEALKSEFGDSLRQKPESDWLLVLRPFAVAQMMDLIRADLALLDIRHDVFTSEQALHDAGKIPQAILLLEAKGLIYRGVLEPPKGKLPDDWEAREQLLFRSTQFGDDTDRALQKPDGSYTYFAADLAYILDKIERGSEVIAYMFGADHGGYKKRMEAAIHALSDGHVSCDIKLCQLVNLIKDGEPVKMSKRAGNFETVRDVVEAVGKDALRFMMLTRKSDMVMDFDLDKVKEQSRDNPVFYVQYAHARVHSLLRLAEEQQPDALALSAVPTLELLALLTHEAELSLIKKLAEYPRLIEQAALSHEPHRIAFYLSELAALFHGLWNVGQGDTSLRIIIADNPQLTAARLALARSVATVVACGLRLLGVEPLKELR